QERQALSTEPTDEVCEKCGKPMVRRRSRFGEFLGCSGYPDCEGIKRLKSDPIGTGVNCPDCKEGEVLERGTRAGNRSVASHANPSASSRAGTKSSRIRARSAARPSWSRR